MRPGFSISATGTASFGQGLFHIDTSAIGIWGDKFVYNSTLVTIPTVTGGLRYDIYEDYMQGTIGLKNTSALTVYVYSSNTWGTPISGVVSLTTGNTGSGGTPGTYALSFIGGGGSGAAGTYTIGAQGTLANVSLTVNGTGYTSSPVVSLPSGGILGASVTASMSAYPITTLPGLVYLNGAVYVLVSAGYIRGSNAGAYNMWDELNSIGVNTRNDNPVALWMHETYIVAFKDYSTEFFYDAGNPPPLSPLLPVLQAFQDIGCANAYSIAQLDGLTFFMSQTKAQGLSMSVISGMQIQNISTPDVDRVLSQNYTPTATCYAMTTRLNGLDVYILTLKQANLTLIYELQTKQWRVLTFGAAKSAVSVTSITQANGLANATTATAHGFADGDPVTISGASPAGYSGLTNILYINATQFSYPVASTLASPATGAITAQGYSYGYLPFVDTESVNGVDIWLGESDGQLWQSLQSNVTDVGMPIDVNIVSENVSAEDNIRKRVPAIEFMGDKVAANAVIRYTDDDYTTWSGYRTIQLNALRAQIVRCGSTYQRAFQFRYNGPYAIRVRELKIEIK